MYVPAVPVPGVQAKVRVVALNVAPVGRPVAEYVSVPPLASVALITNDNADPSTTLLAPISVSTGATLAAVTVIVTISVSNNPPLS